MKFFPALLVVPALIILAGCGKHVPVSRPAEELPPARPVRALMVTPSQSPIFLQWGSDTAITLNVVWSDSNPQPVTLSLSADNPRWLKAELVPSSVVPPATARLQLGTTRGNGLPGPATLVLNATSPGLDSVQHIALLVTLRRVAGDFTRVQPASRSQSCDSICGYADPFGQLDFYDLRPEFGQTCVDSLIPPASQAIGGRTLVLSNHGFGYGASCKVAVVWERTGMLSFVNLGLSAALPRGAVLTSLRGGEEAWLSPDNTVAVVRFAEFLVPIDVPSGRELGAPCAIADSAARPTLAGDSLKAGKCVWQIL